jgi:cytochrome c-type biogenesis protein
VDAVHRPDPRRDRDRRRHLVLGAPRRAAARVYCAGLGVPFLVTGLAFGKATAALTVVKRHYPVVIGVGGVVLIGMGVLIWTGQFSVVNTHVNNWLNSLGLPI